MNANQVYGVLKKYVEDTLAGAGALKGVGISKVEINANNHLIVTFDKPLPDGTTQQDVGALPTGGSYTEEITTPSQLWTIQHNLDTSCEELAIITIDGDGNYIIGDIDTINSSKNQLIISFKEAVTGKIIIKK